MQCKKLSGFLSLAMALLAYGSLRARALDTACLSTESKKTQIGWLSNDLPDRKLLPSIAALQTVGAFVIQDEVMYNYNERIYSFKAMLGSAESINELGSIDFGVDLGQYAEILARVQNPDGSVTVLKDADMQCTVIRYLESGETMGKSFSPKRYSFRFPGLQPGSVINYQIALRYHRGSNDKIITAVEDVPGNQGTEYRMTQQNVAVDEMGRSRVCTTRSNGYYCVTIRFLGDQFSNVLPLRDGAQQRILGDKGNRYPAASITFVYTIPKGAVFEPRLLVPGAKYNVIDVPSKDPYTEKITVIQTNRSVLPHEPYEPEYEYSSPLVATVMRSTAKNQTTRYWLGYKDWSDWLTRNETDYLAMMHEDKAGLAALQDAHPFAVSGADEFAFAKHVTRILRDEVANSQGDEIRTGSGLRPPADLFTASRTGFPIEKALSLIAMLRTKNQDARLVYVRPPSSTPMDRALPMSDWFDYARFLVAVVTPNGRRYFDPVGQVAAGSLTALVQGGEALVVSDRKTFEWVTLPVSAEDDNVTAAVLRFSGVEAGTLKGSLRIEMSGHAAERFRRLRELSPEDFMSVVRNYLERGSLQTSRFNNIQIENRAVPDKPFVITADVEAAGALSRMGGKSRLAPLLVRPGPLGSTFAAVQRAQDVDFHIPERYDLVVHLPDSLGKITYPEAVVFSGESGGYRYELAAEEGGTKLTRQLRLHGRVPAGRYGELRDFMQKIEAQDRTDLIVAAP